MINNVDEHTTYFTIA